MGQVFDYARAGRTAARLIARFGAAATLRAKRAPALGDDPWAPSPFFADMAIRAVLTNYSDVERQGTLIAQGDRKVLFSALGLPTSPMAGDQIVIGERVFTIVDLGIVEPGGIAVLYSAQVRL